VPDDTKRRTATLLMKCKDQKGLVHRISDFIYRHGGNILHADQHIDFDTGFFLSRVEWDLEGFALGRMEIPRAFAPLAEPLEMEWRLQFSDEPLRVALFVSRLGHCLMDLLHRWRIGELRCEIVAIVSNHEIHEPAARAHGIPYHVFPVTPENKREQEEKDGRAGGRQSHPEYFGPSPGRRQAPPRDWCYLWFMSSERPGDPDPQARPAEAGGRSIYGEYDTFLKVAIKEYYDRGWTARKGNFIALLIASGQTAFSIAKDSVVDGTGTKKVAIGAALILALRIGLRYALGGPLGLILTVAAGASMISYFLRNQKDIVRKVGTYRTLIGETRQQYEDLQNAWRSGRHDVIERNLMIDGLMKRFLQQCDEA